MEWNQSLEEMTRRWTELQTQLLSGFNAGMAAAGSASAWQQSLDAWKRTVDAGLDAQAEWLNRWAEQAPAGDGAEAQAWAAQGQAMLKAWLDSNRQLWARCFEMARAMDPGRTAWTGAAAPEALRGWQEMARQMAEAQSSWLKSWGRS